MHWIRASALPLLITLVAVISLALTGGCVTGGNAIVVTVSPSPANVQVGGSLTITVHVTQDGAGLAGRTVTLVTDQSGTATVVPVTITTDAAGFGTSVLHGIAVGTTQLHVSAGLNATATVTVNVTAAGEKERILFYDFTDGQLCMMDNEPGAAVTQLDIGGDPSGNASRVMMGAQWSGSNALVIRQDRTQWWIRDLSTAIDTSFGTPGDPYVNADPCDFVADIAHDGSSVFWLDPTVSNITVERATLAHANQTTIFSPPSALQNPLDLAVSPSGTNVAFRAAGTQGLLWCPNQPGATGTAFNLTAFGMPLHFTWLDDDTIVVAVEDVDLADAGMTFGLVRVSTDGVAGQQVGPELISIPEGLTVDAAGNIIYDDHPQVGTQDHDLMRLTAASEYTTRETLLSRAQRDVRPHILYW
jgi:hypothetical protein